MFKISHHQKLIMIMPVTWQKRKFSQCQVQSMGYLLSLCIWRSISWSCRVFFQHPPKPPPSSLICKCPWVVIFFLLSLLILSCVSTLIQLSSDMKPGPITVCKETQFPLYILSKFNSPTTIAIVPCPNPNALCYNLLFFCYGPFVVPPCKAIISIIVVLFRMAAVLLPIAKVPHPHCNNPFEGYYSSPQSVAFLF